MSETTDSGAAPQAGAGEQEAGNAVGGGTGKRLTVGVIARVGLAGSGWLFAKNQANITAKDRIDGFLIRHDLRRTVAYGDVSGSPFGFATLSDVRITMSPSAVAKAGSLTVSEIDMDGDMILGLRLTAQSVEVPLLKLAQDNPRDNSLHHAIGLGYTTLNGSIDISFRIDDEKGVLSLDTSGDADEAGSWKLRLKLGGFDGGTLNSLYEITKSTGGEVVQKFLEIAIKGAEAITKLTLVEASLSLENSDYFQRSNDIPIADIPPDGGSAAPRVAAINDTELVRGGMNPSEAREAVMSIDEWVKEGGALQIESNLTQPVPLFKQGNLFSPTFDSIGKYLAATKSKITH